MTKWPCRLLFLVLVAAAAERQDLLQQQPITLKTCWPKLVCLARQRQKLVKRKGSKRDMAPHLFMPLSLCKDTDNEADSDIYAR